MGAPKQMIPLYCSLSLTIHLHVLYQRVLFYIHISALCLLPGSPSAISSTLLICPYNLMPLNFPLCFYPHSKNGLGLFMSQLFIGFGFPYEGPAPLEAIANGCIFLQPKFQPPHSSLNHEFFRGKPTSREVSSQHLLPPRISFTSALREEGGMMAPNSIALCLCAGVLTAPICRTVHRQTACHDGGLQQLPRVRICHQGNLEDRGTFAHHALSLTAGGNATV